MRVQFYSKSFNYALGTLIFLLVADCGFKSDSYIKSQMERSFESAEKLENRIRSHNSPFSPKDINMLAKQYDDVAKMAPDVKDTINIQDYTTGERQLWLISSKALTKIGQLYMEQGQLNQAEIYFTNFGKKHTLDSVRKTVVLKYLAKIAERQKSYVKAVELYDELAKIHLKAIESADPDSEALGAPLKAAQMCLKLNNPEQYNIRMDGARDYYTNLIRTYPGTILESAAIEKVATCYLQQNRIAEAIETLNRISNGSDGQLSPEVLLTIGNIYQNEMKDFDKAGHAFQNFRNIYPEDKNVGIAILGEATSLFRLGKYDEAIASMTDIQKISNISVQTLASAYYLMAQCYDRLNKWDEAVSQFDILKTKFAGHDQAFEAALYVPGRYRTKGQAQEAKRAFTDAIDYINSYAQDTLKDNESKARAINYLARAYCENNDYFTAARKLEYLHENFRNCPAGKMAPLKLADIYVTGLADTSKALMWLRTYLNENPYADNFEDVNTLIFRLEALRGDTAKN